MVKICTIKPNSFMTRDVQLLLKARNTAARANQKRGLRDAKSAHMQRIEDQDTSNHQAE